MLSLLPFSSESFVFVLALVFVLVLYGCKTWSVALTEEHRLTVVENRVLRGIFGPKRYEITGGWRKLHDEDLHNLYSSPNAIIMISQGE
jgi:hypothetical protein